MVKHIVMYKLIDPSIENAEAMREVFMSMQGKIDLLVDIKAGVDVLRTERSFDVVLECTFNSLDDMAAYQEHSVHIPVKEYVRERIVKAHAVDYEC